MARFDWLSLILYFSLVSIGLLNIYSAVYNTEQINIASFFIEKQMVSFVIGIILIILIQFFDIKFLERYSSIFFLISIFSLLGLWLVGEEISGALSWYSVGNYSFQPSEFAKIAVAMALAKHLSDFNTDIARTKDFLGAFLIIGIPATLTVLQPDPGTAIILLSFFLVLHAEGLPIFFIYIIFSLFVLFIITLLIGVNATLLTILTITTILLVYLKKRSIKKLLPTTLISLISTLFTLSTSYIFDNVFEQRHRDRFNIILGKEVDMRGIGYNINQSQIAIGSGGGLGKGYLQGTQTKGGFVPEQQTDYIFTTIGEEWGFIGTFTVILLFTFLMLRIVNNAYKQKSTYCRVFCLCFACILMVHFGINIGMVLGLVPTIGIPLPMISYGGSSLLAFSIFLGIYLRIYYLRTS